MPIATMTIPEVYAHRGATPTQGANMTTIEEKLIEEAVDAVRQASRCSPGSGMVLDSGYARVLLAMLFEPQATPKPPAWVVTWRRAGPGHVGVIDGTSTLASWPSLMDYIERIVPRGATFTVKPA